MLNYKLVVIVLVGFMVTACATSQLQSPCDQYAHFCGSKTKISQW
jgi:hypothetical protein